MKRVIGVVLVAFLIGLGAGYLLFYHTSDEVICYGIEEQYEELLHDPEFIEGFCGEEFEKMSC